MFWKRLINLWEQILSQWSSDPLERCRWIKFPVIRKSVSDTHKDQLARAGESAAVNYLAAKGFSILHQNIRFPEGELDIVAHHKNTLVFIEVKTRRTEQFGQPYQFVSENKQRRQVALASRFLSLCRLGKTPIRFDVVSVLMPPNQPPIIEHIENAFLAKDL